MLYDGAIKFLNQAKERMEAKDYAGKGNFISNAIDVINELASSLNTEKGGEFAATLGDLYFYCNKRLFMANSRMDPAGIDEVVKILSGIRSAYAQIMDKPEVVAAMAKAPIAAGKPVRTPSGVQAGPTGGAPVPTAKAHNAYARSLGAAGTAAMEEAPAASAPAPQADTETAKAAETTEAAPATEPAAVQETAAPAATPLLDDGPLLDDMPPLTPEKSLAASNLYRKFAS